MNGAAQTLLSEGERLFAALEKETRDCLESLGRLGREGAARFVARRQEILESIQKFDAECACFLNQPSQEGAGEPGVREEFRRRLGAALRRVVEADGILRALAGREMAALDAELNAIARGRHALKGYGGKGHPQSSSLDRSA
jgi:hypothetical protein